MGFGECISPYLFKFIYLFELEFNCASGLIAGLKFGSKRRVVLDSQ